MKNLLVFLSIILIIQISIASYADDIKEGTETYIIKGNTVKANILEIPVDIELKMQIGLGSGKVGGVEELSAIAQRNGALLAVNGTFFNPVDYNDQPSEPYGTLILEGRVIHIGNTGAIFGVDKNGKLIIKQLRIKIEGGTNGSYKWPNNWYAYGFNHTPAGPDISSVYIYTPERGQKVGYSYGTRVVVSRGQIINIVENKDVKIPEDGYVVVMTGAELQHGGASSGLWYNGHYIVKPGRKLSNAIR